MNRISSILITTLLLLPPALMAETGTDTTTTTATSFNELSSGNQMIARSLMDAQVVSDDNSEIWTLDQIAAAKSETGWGNVFKQMQAEGLIDAKNLGQVVSNYARNTNSGIPESVAVEAGIPSDNTLPDDENSDAMVMEQGPADGGATGEFNKLSPGNQKIARSLMDAQTLPANGTTQPWNLDQIAAAKGETGWGNVFQQMQTEGLIDAKNLGQIVSQYQHTNNVSTAINTPVVTTAAGTTTGHSNNGNASSHNDVNNTGIVTATSNANGNAYGHSKNHPISASNNIVTATGADISGNVANSSINTGSNGHGMSATHAAGNSTVTGTTSVSTPGGNGQGHAYGRFK